TPAMTNPIWGYGIVYGSHTYCIGCTEGTLTPGIDNYILIVAAKSPVVITEFGEYSSAGGFNTNLIQYAQSHHLGWLAFVRAGGGARGRAVGRQRRAGRAAEAVGQERAGRRGPGRGGSAGPSRGARAHRARVCCVLPRGQRHVHPQRRRRPRIRPAASDKAAP